LIQRLGASEIGLAYQTERFGSDADLLALFKHLASTPLTKWVNGVKLQE